MAPRTVRVTLGHWVNCRDARRGANNKRFLPIDEDGERAVSMRAYSEALEHNSRSRPHQSFLSECGKTRSPADSRWRPASMAGLPPSFPHTRSLEVQTRPGELAPCCCRQGCDRPWRILHRRCRGGTRSRLLLNDEPPSPDRFSVHGLSAPEKAGAVPHCKAASPDPAAPRPATSRLSVAPSP